MTGKSTSIKRKTVYSVLAIVIVLCASIISLRTTNVLHEQRLENWNVGDANTVVQGIVLDVKFNYEINTGYSYHVFGTYTTLNVTDVVSVKESFYTSNVTKTKEYLQSKTIIVGCDLTNVPKVSGGKLIEVSGFFAPWIEDSVFSGKLIVAPYMSDGYFKLL